MNRKKILIFCGLVILIIALTVLCIFVRKDAKEQEAKEEAEPVKKVEEMQREDVIDETKEDDITSITYKNQYGEFTLNKEESGNWYFDHDVYIRVDQYKVKNMLERVMKLEADDKVDSDMSQKENFGLDNPGMVISLSLMDGSKKTYNIGMLNEAKQGYYLNIEGQNEIYFIRVTMYNLFNVDVMGMVERLKFPVVTGENVLYVEIAKDGQTYKIEEMSKLETFIGSVAVNDCCAVGVKDEDMAKYGLNPSFADVTVYYNDLEDGEAKKYVLHIGSVSEKTSEYYVTKGDTKEVYTMGMELVNKILKYAQ